MMWKISSNYGTFEIHRTVDAPNRDAALEECGIMQTLMEAGWLFDGNIDGEEHEAELLPTVTVTEDQGYTLRHIKKIFDSNTGPDGWDICILEEIEQYLMLRGVEVNEHWMDD